MPIKVVETKITNIPKTTAIMDIKLFVSACLLINKIRAVTMSIIPRVDSAQAKTLFRSALTAQLLILEQ